VCALCVVPVNLLFAFWTLWQREIVGELPTAQGIFAADLLGRAEVGKRRPTIGQLNSEPDALADGHDVRSSAAEGVPVRAGFRASQAASAADA